MPTYDYICSSCGRTTEIVHSINGGAPSACPACGAVGTLRKAFNPPTIHFKGSGWAKKDRSGGRPKPAKSSEPADSGSAKSGSEAKGSDEGRSASPDGSGEGGSKTDSGSTSADSKPAAAAASSTSAD